jgi:hypothetical protein
MREAIHKILIEDLGKWKICTRFILDCLTNDGKLVQEFIQSVHDDGSLLVSVVTGDETWCFQYDTQTKKQSMEWCLPSSSRHKKF